MTLSNLIQFMFLACNVKKQYRSLRRLARTQKPKAQEEEISPFKDPKPADGEVRTWSRRQDFGAMLCNFNFSLLPYPENCFKR